MPTTWRAYSSLPPWVRVLLVGQLVNSAGSVAGTFLTLYLVQARGLSAGAAGVIAAAYGVGLLVGNLNGGRLADRFGARPTLVWALVGWALTCALFPLAPVAVLFPLAFAAAATGGAVRPVMATLLMTAVPAQRRREAAALLRVAMNAGMIVGPPVAGILAARWFPAVFAVDAATSIVMLVVIARAVPRAADTLGTRPVSRGVWSAVRTDRALRRLLVAIVAADGAYRMIETILPLQLRIDGAAPRVYGLLLALNCVGVVVLETPLAIRLGRRPPRLLIAVGVALLGVGYVPMTVAPTVSMGVFAVLLVTAGEIIYKPTATAYAADLAPQSLAGRYQSAYAGASVAGFTVTPLVCGPLFEWQPRSAWAVASAAALVAAACLAAAHRAADSRIERAGPTLVDESGR